MKKRIGAALLCCSILLGGCMENVQLKDRAIVQEVGIDYETGNYFLTLQVFNPEGDSGKGSFDATKKNNIVVQSSGTTITEAFQQAADYLGKEPFLGINQLIVIGMDTAKKGMDNLIDYFNSYDGARANAYVVVSPGKASEIVSSQIDVGILPAAAILSMAEEKERMGSAEFATVFSILSSARTPGKDITVPILQTHKGPTGAVVPEMTGCGILVDNQLVDTMDNGLAEGIQWAAGKVQQSALSLETEELGKIAVTIHSSKSNITCRVEEGKPTFRICIHADGTLYEVSGQQGAFYSEDISCLEQAAEKQICRQVEAALEKTIRQNKADLLGLGRCLYKWYPGYWNQAEGRWRDILPTVEIAVEAAVTIDRAAPTANADILESTLSPKR